MDESEDINNSEKKQPAVLNVSGRQLVDIQYFVWAILDFPHDGLFSCAGNNVTPIKEIRKGLFSTLVLWCNSYNVTHRICTEDPETEEVNVNSAAVTEIISSALGYSNLEAFCSMMNRPCMSQKI
ncbi:hypothetical protein ILUMI_17780 [Ignelater luminosus]|uniref:Mutator-like transposase domain-containing protein n=1 Tax=Ignelater luminosus TaxID=2038154 RepID=A0A8K0CPV2_IGNLU|nr:hypothetical protein ILUMI_17780 [Ignelater luminosus]